MTRWEARETLTERTLDIRTAELISVGTELLLGQTLNTNAHFLAGQLADLGISCYRQTVVGDNAGRLEEAICRALDDNDLVITTGGLGPTEDDLTTATTARIAGLPLVKDPGVDADLMARFPDRNYGPEASYPVLVEGSLVFINDQGTAPASLLRLDWKGKRRAILILPGPPHEMEPLFVTRVRPYLQSLCPDRFIHRYVRLFGIGESEAEARIRDLIDSQDQVTLAPYASLTEVVLRVSQRLVPGQETDATGPVIQAIQERLGDYIFEIGPRTLPQVLFDLLLEKKLKLAFAESCTAGLAAASLASLPGASAVLKGGFITYDNAMKTSLLAISADLIRQKGPVSQEVAEAMAQAALEKTGADLALSITGLAGPSGGSPGLPVGRVWLATAAKGMTTQAECFQFSGDRNQVRIRAAYQGLDLIRRRLLSS